MALLTGSRAAMIGVVIVLAALLVLRPRLDADRPAPLGTSAAAAVLLTGAVLASAYVVLHDWSATTSLDDRPHLWNVAAEYREESPLFGYGPDRWETLYTETGEIRRTAQTSTHNQWVDVLFITGWVGAAILVAMIATIVWSARYARPAVLIVLAAAFIAGTTDTAWSVGVVDLRSFALIALILLGPTGAVGRAGPRDEPRPLPARAALPSPAG
jgi:O-antigen ligase